MRRRTFFKWVAAAAVAIVAAPLVRTPARWAVAKTRRGSARFRLAGDGVTDDTAAVQAAINFVAERGGGVITFSAGVFEFKNRVI